MALAVRVFVTWEVKHGDCREVMALMEPASVDAIVTDPPYGLGFMGKDWDSPGGTGDFPMRRTRETNTVNTGVSRQGGRQRSCEDFAKRQARDVQAFEEQNRAWCIEAYRVLKPGGHIIAFGGTRTFHRLTCALEDAGFEIRDCLMWLYGTGFPKSLDVSKVIDKAAGAERTESRPYVAPDGKARGSVVSDWAYSQARDGASTRRPDDKTSSAAARAWAGWGTALKPAWEPIIVARKPLVGTVAANVQAHGTGALNIDGCRIAAVGGSPSIERRKGGVGHLSTAEGGRAKEAVGRMANRTTEERYREQREGESLGRWPANLVLDEVAAAMLDEQTGTLTSGANPTRRGSDKFKDTYGDFAGKQECVAVRGLDVGGASRFFYTAKASSGERHYAGKNTHPTVKPVSLMRWLVRLVTPPGGLILDPFCGSGSTGVAALSEGFLFIGIDNDPESAATARRRIAGPLFAESGA